jgi:hypothetical protein
MGLQAGNFACVESSKSDYLRNFAVAVRLQGCRQPAERRQAASSCLTYKPLPRVVVVDLCRLLVPGLNHRHVGRGNYIYPFVLGDGSSPSSDLLLPALAARFNAPYESTYWGGPTGTPLLATLQNTLRRSSSASSLRRGCPSSSGHRTNLISPESISSPVMSPSS